MYAVFIDKLGYMLYRVAESQTVTQVAMQSQKRSYSIKLLEVISLEYQSMKPFKSAIKAEVNFYRKLACIWHPDACEEEEV